MDRALPPDAHRVDAQDRLDEPMLILDIQRRAHNPVPPPPPTHDEVRLPADTAWAPVN